jgi:hypothetical protein
MNREVVVNPLIVDEEPRPRRVRVVRRRRENGEGEEEVEEEEPEDPNDEETWFRVTPENIHTFFRLVHGRKLNTVQPVYQLPSDAEEVKVRF